MYQFNVMDPDKAYITNNLALPKRGLNLKLIKNALTFQYGEEEVLNEMGELVEIRPAQMNLWSENQHHIIVPREFLRPEQFPQFGFEFVDLRPDDFEELGFEDIVALRNQEQADAFNAMLNTDSGTLNLACGKGKTVLALKLAATLNVPTIVVVNTTALLEQWRKEIQKFLCVEPGIIQGDEASWQGRGIVLATVHTLAGRRELWPMSFRRRFGLAFYDEGHHMSAPVFVRSADLFFGRRYSLTATAKRLDGLESIYLHHLGPVFYSDLSQELIPLTIFHRLKWQFDPRDKPFVTDSNGDLSLPRIRTFLGSLDWRNHIIVQDALHDLLKGRQLLILSHSVEHVGRLRDKLHDWDWPAGIITGATPQGDRMRILHESNPVIGTFQLAREGLDKPNLDTLYITTPFSSPNDMQQAWGRIQRMYGDKESPLVRVYEDLALKPCASSCSGLRATLKRMDYQTKLKNIKVEEHCKWT